MPARSTACNSQFSSACCRPISRTGFSLSGFEFESAFEFGVIWVLSCSRLTSLPAKPFCGSFSEPPERFIPDLISPSSLRSILDMLVAFACWACIIPFIADFSRARREFLWARRLAGRTHWGKNQRAREKPALNRHQIHLITMSDNGTHLFATALLPNRDFHLTLVLFTNGV